MRHVFTLGIDIGTFAIKAGTFDQRSGRIAAARHRPVESQRGCWDAFEFWHILKRLIGDLLTRVDRTRVAAIGITGMAEAGCLINRQGEPTTPILLWHDRRGVRQAAAWRPQIEQHLRSISGLRMTSVRSLAKWRWLANQGASNHDRWCGLPELAALRLTGIWQTEPTLAARTGAYDVFRGAYDERMLALAGAPAGLFPPVIRPPAIAGALLPQVAEELGLSPRVTVTIAGHDDVVAAYGAGAAVGGLVDSAGTAEALVRVFTPPPHPRQVAHEGLSIVPFFGEGAWAVLKGVGATGGLMRQVAGMLGEQPAALDRIATPPGEYSEGTIRARVSVRGMPSVRIAEDASEGEIWSAVLDLVAERTAKAVRKIARVAGGAEKLVIVGGGANSAELCRRKGSKLKLPIVRLPDVEATTRGAAALARNTLR